MSEVHIKIDNQEKTWPKSVITPKDILKLGGKPEPYSSYIIFKIQKGTTEEIWKGEAEELHKNISIENGDAFEIKYNRAQKLTIRYTVNGEVQEISTNENKLTVKKILEKANFVPVEKFKLFNAKTDTSYTDSNQEVTIHDGDEFLALSSGPTPVA